MASFILNILSTEAAINTVASTVSNASFVRIYNGNAAVQIVTKQNVVANTANVSFSVPPGQEFFLLKSPADTLTANASGLVVASSVKVRGG